MLIIMMMMMTMIMMIMLMIRNKIRTQAGATTWESNEKLLLYSILVDSIVL